MSGVVSRFCTSGLFTAVAGKVQRIYERRVSEKSVGGDRRDGGGSRADARCRTTMTLVMDCAKSTLLRLCKSLITLQYPTHQSRISSFFIIV